MALEVTYAFVLVAEQKEFAGHQVVLLVLKVQRNALVVVHTALFAYAFEKREY